MFVLSEEDDKKIDKIVQELLDQNVHKPTKSDPPKSGDSKDNRIYTTEETKQLMKDISDLAADREKEYRFIYEQKDIDKLERRIFALVIVLILLVIGYFSLKSRSRGILDSINSIRIDVSDRYLSYDEIEDRLLETLWDFGYDTNKRK